MINKQPLKVFTVKATPKKETKHISRRPPELTKETASKASRSWWNRLKRDHKVRFVKDHVKEEEKKSTLKRQQKSIRKRYKLLDKHLSIDQLAAKRKLEQLKLLTRTDLSIVNSAEPYRVSGFVLFKDNLLDASLYICLFMLVNYHIESYKSFKTINKSVEVFSRDFELRKQFLCTHLGYNPKRKLSKTPNPNKQELNTHPSSIDEPEYIEPHSLDSFHWINMIIEFFWPYLSHIIHYELNEFFRDQIESGSMANSDEGMKRLFYAIIRQLDTNILVIEKCELGHQAPFIRGLNVHEGMDSHQNKTLVYNINLEYNGDMNIAVIYRYFCCLSSRVGLKDVFLRFKLCCTLGPIKKDVPFIEQVKFTLVELPEFGYKGIALAELAELKIVRGVVNRMITENLLFPQQVTVSLADLFRTLINGPPPVAPQIHHRLAIDQANSDDNGANVSFLTRLAARLVLCSCMCSNICLRCCSKK